MRFFCLSISYWFILTLIGMAYPTYQTLVLVIMAAPFALLGLLALVYKYMFSLSARIRFMYDEISEKVGSYLPRKDIPRRGKSPFNTAFKALLSGDPRDLFYFLTAGPSVERYFILRDISDGELKRCIKKLGRNAPQVAIEELNNRMNGITVEFDRLETGRPR